jgi:hypothetical protein
MVVFSFLGTAPASADLPLRAAEVSGPYGDEKLSDELKVTRWAVAIRKAPIRAFAGRGREVTRLRYYTEDHFDETYIVLRSHVREDGKVWLQVRVPGRPNGRKGWVPQDALGPLHVVRTYLRINKTTLRATLYKSGRKIWTSRVGIGGPGTPTPAGHFWVRERFSVGQKGGPYGPFAFGTSAYSVLSDWPGGGVVGIHGTNAPGLIPGRPSHGCVRLPNQKVLQLKKLMPVGTPIRIL